MKKKQMLAALLIAALAVTACGKKEEGQRSKVNTADSSSITEDSVADEPVETLSIDGFSNNTPLIPRDQLPYSGTEYVHGDFSIVIPNSMDGKYTIEEDTEKDGFIVYQTASKEVDGSGILFRVYKTDNLELMEESAVIVMAYTPDAVYNLELPFEDDCVEDDTKIKNEYKDMLLDSAVIPYSLNVAADNVNYKVAEYTLPGSECFDVDDEIIEKYTHEQLYLAKEEIYARHGKIFYDNDTQIGNLWLQDHFDAMSWYEAKNYDVSDSDLSDIEKANLEKIDKAMAEKAKNIPVCQSISVNQAFNYDIDDDGVDEEVLYYGEEDKYGDIINPIISIDGKEYNIDDFDDVDYWEYPCLDLCYWFKLDDGTSTACFLAILDDGPSADPETHIFRCTEDGLEYEDTFESWCFDSDPPYCGLDEFGYITEDKRTEIPDSLGDVCVKYRYDMNQNRFVELQGLHDYAWVQGHKLLDDLDVYFTGSILGTTYTFKKGQTVYFEAMVNLGYLGSEIWIKVKNEDGVYGYIRIDPAKFVELNSGKTFDELFDDLKYFG